MSNATSGGSDHPGSDSRDATVRYTPNLPSDSVHHGTEESDQITTAGAPRFPAVLPPATPHSPFLPVNLPAPGERLHDFEILRVLGEGSFARVYLARQVSLDRPVALKVSANQGSEARTLASLEHHHIVQVFLETADPERDLRLLCMQYVPGTTLERIIRTLRQRQILLWNGRTILEMIDALDPQPVALDPTALRDREELNACDGSAAACWIGARLAEALAYAHSQGVLHRDIKPANILLNRYGQPFLADFNIAFDPTRVREADGDRVGGTLAYMAPEHLEAFSGDPATPPTAVDQRSDIYSLGLVLFELLTGRLPVEPACGSVSREGIRHMAAERRAAVPCARQIRPHVPEILEQVLGRCLHPEPQRRYQTAAELAQALEGCRQLHRIHGALPPAGPLVRAAQRHALLWLLILAFLPHVVGSLVNIAYNHLQIVNRLTPAQQSAFMTLLLGYNLAVYPVCLWVFYRLVAPVFRTWRRLKTFQVLDGLQVSSARRRSLGLARWAVVLSCLGWFVGTPVLPIGIHLLAGPLGPEVFGHFLISFAIAGLIALTYSYFGVQLIVLRVLYPRLWSDPQNLGQQVRAELGAVRLRPWMFQLLAGVIPLAAAVLMVAGGPEITEYRTFRLLVTVLIFMGMAGFGLAVLANNVLAATETVLLGTERRTGQVNHGGSG